MPQVRLVGPFDVAFPFAVMREDDARLTVRICGFDKHIPHAWCGCDLLDTGPKCRSMIAPDIFIDQARLLPVRQGQVSIDSIKCIRGSRHRPLTAMERA